MKKKVICLALISLNAISGTLGPIQTSEHHWKIGGQALYLKPSSEAGTRPEVSVTSMQNNKNTIGVDPSWSWGFQLEGAYYLSKFRDININWHHFAHSNAKTSLPVTDVYLNIGDLYSGLNPLLDLFSSQGFNSSVNVNWDQVNIEVARTSENFENTTARLHGGLNLSRARVSGSTLGDYIAKPPGSTTNSYNVYYVSSSSFTGLGPRIGVDLSYSFFENFSIMVDGALSVLAGSSNSYVYRQVYVQSLKSLYAGNTGFKHTHVAGELDADLELRYIKNFPQGNLSVNVGWLFTNYLNTFSYSKQTENSFEIQGLYFGLRWLN